MVGEFADLGDGELPLGRNLGELGAVGRVLWRVRHHVEEMQVLVLKVELDAAGLVHRALHAQAVGEGLEQEHIKLGGVLWGGG